MATYIYYGEGEVDTTLQGAEWLQQVIYQRQGEESSNVFAEKFRALHEDDNQSDIFYLFVEHSEGLFAAIPETRGDDRVKDVESFFALLFSMLVSLDVKEEVLTQATTKLCDILVSKKDQQPDLRLRLLMMLYNTFHPQLEFRYQVFKCILDYSSDANLFDQVVPYLEYLDAWMNDWERFMTDEDKRNLFHNVASYLRKLGKRVDAFLQLKRYHMLFQGVAGDHLKDQKVYAAAVQLLVDAIALPSVIQFDDILGYDTIKALAKSKDKALVQLCEIFLQGSVNDLRDFEKKNAALFKEHGLEVQDCMSKIKLLTLASMAQHRSELTLAEVAAKLEEKEDSVERWVVRAVSENIIDGRIDQLNNKVIVKSAFQRKFEKDEWAFLDTKLSQWVDNLEHVIKFIGEQKEAKAAAGVATVN